VLPSGELVRHGYEYTDAGAASIWKWIAAQVRPADADDESDAPDKPAGRDASTTTDPAD
jgi:hypothetical protein